MGPGIEAKTFSSVRRHVRDRARGNVWGSAHFDETRPASRLQPASPMTSIAVFILASFIVGLIARALASAPDPGTGMTLIIGAGAQVVASFATFILGFGHAAQPWSFIAAIALAAGVLSFYQDATPAPARIEVPPCDPGVVLPPSLQPHPAPVATPSWSTRLGAAAGLAAGGGFLMGFTGFVIGFFGPIRFQPWANQGPMLGLFVTGPGGVLLGAILGIGLGFSHPEWSTRRRIWILNAANVAWGLFILNLVMDRSKWH